MWVKYNPNPCGRDNVGDCTLRAMCAALNMDWDTAFWELAISANNMCDIQPSNAALSAVLRKHGFNREVIPNTCPDCYTADDFCRDHPYGTFVLGFGNHVATVIDGKLYDSWDSGKCNPQYYFYKKGT